MQPNQLRQIHLFNQIKLQTKRNGIHAVFVGGSQFSFPYFEFDSNSTDVLTQWLNDKYSINIYIKSNLVQIESVNRDIVYLEGNRIYFTERKSTRNFRNGYEYIIAKNNATLMVLSKVFQETHRIKPDLNYFINKEEVREIKENKIASQNWFYKGLTCYQRQAVDKVLTNQITFIKGPPGCGKTTTISRLCRIFGEIGKKVLVGAVSKAANLVILRQLLKQMKQEGSKLNVVLYLYKETKDENRFHEQQVRDVTLRKRLIDNFFKVNTSNPINPQAVEDLLDMFWANRLKNDTFMTIYYQAMAKTLVEADVVIVTTVSTVQLQKRLKEYQKFQPYIGILDEASQASWADTYCFLCRGIEKFVLSGDEKQLPPTVISQNQILKETMFMSLKEKNPNYFYLLKEQRRMHPVLAEFPNQYFYEGKLINGISAKDRQSSISYFQKYPLSFINVTQKQNEVVEPLSGKKNYWNQAEIKVILQILALFSPQDYPNIGIISPYDLQIQKISQVLGYEAFQNGLTIRTCDGYQGGEKDYIIVSFVRSNDDGRIGFCKEESRFNVTLTRAKKGLVLIGNIQTFECPNADQKKKVWFEYIKYLKEKQLNLSLNHSLQEIEKGKKEKVNESLKRKAEEEKAEQSKQEKMREVKKEEKKEEPQEINKIQKKKKNKLILESEDSDEDEEEILFKKNKKHKKKLINILSNIRTTQEKYQKNPCLKYQDQLKDYQNELQSLITANDLEVQKIITKMMLREYEENELKIELYHELLKEELEKVKKKIWQEKEYNHLKEKEIVFRFIRARNMIKLIELYL